MKHITRLLVTALFAALPLLGLAEETNALPPTLFEVFESVTGRVIIKGTEEIGSFTAKSGIITVKCHELRDVASNQRQFGLTVIVRQNEQVEDATIIDDDELDSLVHSIDYISKADPSLSSFSHFEAAYSTKAGFRVASYSSRRTGTVEAALTSNRLIRSKCWLNLAQLAQFKGLLEQAQTKLDSIRKKR
ncbi:MAG: hypothetical protein DME26_22635 [Verrucomicrobia bacterium]|nr:MAG: hypothetical protein DME26_22635 [Verrucomicrobiota bacterium]